MGDGHRLPALLALLASLFALFSLAFAQQLQVISGGESYQFCLISQGMGVRDGGLITSGCNLFSNENSFTLFPAVYAGRNCAINSTGNPTCATNIGTMEQRVSSSDMHEQP